MKKKRLSEEKIGQIVKECYDEARKHTTFGCKFKEQLALLEDAGVVCYAHDFINLGMPCDYFRTDTNDGENNEVIESNYELLQYCTKEKMPLISIPKSLQNAVLEEEVPIFCSLAGLNKNTTFFGNFNVREYPSLKWLGQGLYVVGDLNFMGTDIESLPYGLEVDGLLLINGTDIEELPKELNVPFIDARNTPLAQKLGGEGVREIDLEQKNGHIRKTFVWLS